MSEAILLIGAGPMAIEYAKILKYMGINPCVLGRGSESAKRFSDEIGISVIENGMDQFSKEDRFKDFNTAIVAVNENLLGDVTRNLIRQGIGKILVEKPGGLDNADIRSVASAAKRREAQVFVGYNRRLYASVQKAKEIIKEDGGVTSFDFEFTEWSHVISELKKDAGVKEEWFLANSSHVVDLAFYLGGKPESISCSISGTSEWHPRAMIYAGNGITEQGALFTYRANWDAPGRWAIEMLTKNHRLYLKPLEKLQIQKKGSVNVEFFDMDYSIDEKFKPGLYRQVEEFLKEDCSLLNISDQCAMLPIYDAIENGKNYTIKL